MRVEIIITGSGGQGVILASVVLGRAAVYDNRHVVQTQTYGSRVRGGPIRTEVIISDENINYPSIISADFLIAMSQESLDKYLQRLKPGGILIIDLDLAAKVPSTSEAKIYKVPATNVAIKQLGTKLTANMIFLGVLIGLSRIVSRSALKKAVKEEVPINMEKINLRAVEKGFEIAEHLETLK